MADKEFISLLTEDPGVAEKACAEERDKGHTARVEKVGDKYHVIVEIKG